MSLFKQKYSLIDENQKDETSVADNQDGEFDSQTGDTDTEDGDDPNTKGTITRIMYYANCIR